MKRSQIFIASLIWALTITFALPGMGQEKKLKALLVTGGCCHEYAKQAEILTKGIAARIDIEWTIVNQGGSTTNTKIPLYENKDWAKGYDIVIHNECFAGVKDVEWVEGILKPHREGGVPAVVIHCAMHCYRTGKDDWFQFCGVTSRGHGAHYAYTINNVDPKNPIMKSFGETWTTPKGELYRIEQLWPNAKPLGRAKEKNGKDQVCIWTNEYGKARVFGTTIGHHAETMADPKYLDFLSRGILWAVKREKDDIRKPSEHENAVIEELLKKNIKQPSGKKPPLAAVKASDKSIAKGKKATASSEEANKSNFAKNAFDGNLGTRWCANGTAAGSFLQVDLEKPQNIKGIRIYWEQTNYNYQYIIEGSADGKNWKQLVDQTKRTDKKQASVDKLDAKEVRYLKVKPTNAVGGHWPSLWEMEVFDGPIPPTVAKIGGKAPASPGGLIGDIKAPEDLEYTVFAMPPKVNYPVCITAAPTGEVFVGVDDQGSLGKTPNRGKILRCIDTDGDGEADKINEFCKVDHPRGLVYDQGTLWVLHPPSMTVYHDDDLDGVADRQKTLITGISTDEVNRRGADHTTNGIRMGIDGWIYIAVGDFGFTEAKGADGTTLAKRGGGVVRIRPDGSEMEIYSWGQRNILDVCIDPYLNIFTRDNTNDGGGWDVRFSHVMQSANYGYPSWYLNYPSEIMPPLQDHGGGSGCGGMFFHDLRWPAPYQNSVMTCDWGRSQVYLHNPPAVGATFAENQSDFIKISRPTDIDVDGSGLLYVSSWKGGKFAYSGENVGYVAQFKPKGFKPVPFPNIKEMQDAELVNVLTSPSANHRFHTQHEILKRGPDASRSKLLIDLASDAKAAPYARVAAIFTLKQLDGTGATKPLVELSKDDTVREFALRALADRKSQLDGVPMDLFVNALKDSNPRVQAAALVGLGRLGKKEAADAILPLTALPSDYALPKHNETSPDRVVPHLAIRALESLQASEALLNGLSGPNRAGALWGLKYQHNETAVKGLIEQLGKSKTDQEKRDVLELLVRLYFKEADYKGGWWGTRPDRTGPYYDRAKWEQTPAIEKAILEGLASASDDVLRNIKEALIKHKVDIKGIPLPKKLPAIAKEIKVVVPKFDPNNPNLIGNMKYDEIAKIALGAKGNAKKGEQLFKQQSCNACHSTQKGQTPIGPHLGAISKRYKPHQLVESIVTPSKVLAQGFATAILITADGKNITGFVTREAADELEIRTAAGKSFLIKKADIEERAESKISVMPEGIVKNLTPKELADLLAYLKSLKE